MMETSELMKSVVESFDKRDCKYIDLIALVSDRNNNFFVDSDKIKDILVSKGYVCYNEIERDGNLSYYRLRVKNKLK